MRTPPHFREELHPEEIVRMPCRFPWLATVALVVTTIAAAILLRVASARQGALPAPDGGSARHAAPAPVPGDGTAGLPGLADGRRR